MKKNYLPFEKTSIININHLIFNAMSTIKFRLTVLFTCLFFGMAANAQVANYAFSQSMGTYTALASPTTLFNAGWDDSVGNVAIPFTFNFNNVNYTTCSVNSNGYITFGGTVSAATGYTPISANTGYAGAIAGLARDLGSNGNALTYATLGSSPNRVLVIQWRDTRRYNGTTLRAANFNFQIRLSETSNLIQVVYGSCTSNYGTDLSVQVGLRGATNGDFNNRTTANNWPASTAGGNNAATCNTGDGTGEEPPTGLTYTWTPRPVITGFNPAAGCAGSSIIITGHNFLNASSVTFNGLPATFTVNSTTQITATIPSGASSGNVVVTTPPGTGTAALTINPPPTVAAITGTLNVCPTATTQLSDATSGGTWSSANNAIATVDASGLVTGIAPGSVTISYTITSGGCSNAATTTVTVTSPTAVSGPVAVCIGSTIQMSPNSGGTWVSNNPSVASIDNTGLVTGIASGTVTFTYTNGTTNCTSTTTNITVNALPAVSAHPAPQSVCSGSSASFSVTATGVGLTYRWYRGATMLSNGGNISGALSPTLTINPVALADAATDYYCIVTGTCAPPAQSNNAALTVTQAVSITSQPIASQSLCSGNTATFSIGATGAGITFQWYNGITMLVDGGNISGATSSTLSLANLTSANASNTYYCIVSGTSPCNPVTSSNSILIVNDGPAIGTQPAPTQTVCAGDPVSFSTTATGGSLTYQWYKGATPLANGGNISGANTPTLTINPTTPGDSAADYHCMVSNGCVVPANTNNASLTVNEKPYIFAYNTSVCSEDTFTLIPTSGLPTVATIVPPGTTYSWSAPTVTGGITGGSAQSNQPAISQTLINPTNTNQTATYTVTPTSGTSGACAGAPFTVVVTVNPLPFVANLSPSVCSGENLTITPTNGGGNIIPAGTTYTWGGPVVTGGMTGGSGGINQTTFNITLTNPTNTVQTANYNVTATSGPCTGSVFTIAVTVHPKPTVAGDVPTQTVCSGTAIAPITISNPNGVGGVIGYSWTRTNTANLTGMPASASGSSIAGTLVNNTNVAQTTTFTLYATSDESCTSTPVTVDVIVNPVPTVTAAPATQTICSGNAIATINFSNPNNVSGTVYSWTRDNTSNLTGIAASGNGTNITGTLTNTTLVQQTTVFTIAATNAGCGTNTTTVTVTVNPRPDVSAAPLTQTVCAGTPITNIVLSNPNALPGTTFSWTRNNTGNTPGIAASGTSATILGTLTNPTGVNQTTTFTIVATRSGCPSTAITVDVVVQPAPLAIATPSAPGICTGSNAVINFSTSNSLAGTTFSWTRDNVANIGGLAASGTGNINAMVTNTTSVNQVSVITVVATAPNGCTRTITATLTVYPTMSTPGIEDSQVVCQGSRPTTFFITTPVTGGSGAYTYQWQSSTSSATGPWTNIGGATASTYQPPTTTGTTPNTWYQVLITSCGQTVTSNSVSVVVANNSNFSFSIDFGGGTVCSGANFNPRIYSAHGGGAYIRYSWIGNPAHISPASGGPLPQDTSQPWWLFGAYLSEGTLPLTVTNTTNAAVTTTISITPMIYDSDTNAFICSLSPQTTTVTIRPRPTVTPTAPNALICSGTSAGVILTSNVTATSQVTYNWTRTDGNGNVTSTMGTGSSGTVAIGSSYTIPDVLTNNSASNQNVTYSITPTSTPGNCPGTPSTITITVSPQLTPGTVGSNQVLCNGGDPAPFTQLTAAVGGGTLTYQWQFSTTSATGPWTDIAGANGTTYDSGPVTQTTWFIRVVTSTISGITCSVGNTTAIQVTVNNITPGGITTTNQTICSGGDPGNLTSTSLATGSGPITYQWQSNTTGCGGTFNNIGGATGFAYDPPAGLTQTTYYRRMATSTVSGTPCTDYTNCVTVFVNTVTGGTVGSDETLCGNNPAAFTITTPATGAGALTYQWQSNTVGCGSSFTNISGATLATYDPPAGLTQTTFYRRITTSTLNGVQCTANSNCITVTANSVTAGTISGNRTVCVGGDPAAFTSSTAGTGAGLTYQWQISTVSGTGPWTDIAGANADSYDAPGPINVVTYFRRLAIATVNATTCNAATSFVTVFINQATAPVMAGDQAVCAQDPVAFTVTTPATFMGTPSYQWQSSTVSCASGWINIIGATGATYDPPVVTQTTYYRVIATSTLNSTPCQAISNCLTVTSNAKTWNGSVSTDWNTPANWTPNGVPTNASCVVVPNTTIKPYVLGANYNAYAYSLTILSGGTLEVIPTNTITVTDLVNVNTGGGFLIKNSANLVQINNVANIGNINMERTTQPMYRYDYTYWGSPLTAASGYTLGNLSPATQPDKYYSWNPTNAGGNGNWVQESAATLMNPIKGYIIRAPQTYSMDPMITQAYTANFIGVPNNGTINVPVAVGTMAAGLFNDKLNLLGNPYPSAVNANLFLNDPVNSTMLDGTLYFWTHHSPPSAAYVNPFYGNFTYNYTAGDYATYTPAMGGTNTVPSGYGGPTPNGYIAAGQAFFVKGLSNGNARFTNAMRGGNNGAFFRSANTEIEKQRVWLNLANAQGGFSQAMVGYAEGATTGYDRGFDGSSFSGNFVSLYSLASDNQTLTIQGRPLPFDVNDQVPLGFNATAANTYTIGIDHFDSQFDNQNIYLEDKLLNVIHDLKQSQYSFTSAAGNFNTRFVLRFTNATLGVKDLNAAVGLIAIIADQKLDVQASENIQSISIYDITGKLIIDFTPKNASKKFSSEFIYADGIYIAKFKLENGAIETRKLINSN